MQAVEVVPAVLIGPELAAEVVVCLVLRVLEVVLAIRRRLPDVDDGVLDRLLGLEVGDDAVHERGLAGVRTVDDALAVLPEGGVGAPEGAEDGGGCRNLVRLGHVRVRDLVD